MPTKLDEFFLPQLNEKKNPTEAKKKKMQILTSFS